MNPLETQTARAQTRAVEECRSGDLALVERNLIEGATLMRSLASEIRGTLRQ
jgi:hypothetical protein